jgi:hypothetical protein
MKLRSCTAQTYSPWIKRQKFEANSTYYNRKVKDKGLSFGPTILYMYIVIFLKSQLCPRNAIFGVLLKFQKVTHWPITQTIFCFCCLLAISAVIMNKYFVWETKFYFVHILLLYDFTSFATFFIWWASNML